MRTPISISNPFGSNRFGFAFEVLADNPVLGRHLDYGCFDGSFLVLLQNHAARDLTVVGVDVNELALRSLSQNGHALPCARISDRGRLPFKDGSFDSISCLEVLEHVSSSRRRELLDEFWRLLSPRGLLIVSTPGQHVFSVFDLGNVKFRFPLLHKLFVQARHGAAHYKSRYQDNEFRLIGDVSVDARWHQHFSRAQLATMMTKANFEVVQADGAGLFALPLTLLGVVVPVKKARRLINRLQHRDAATYDRANLFLASRKQE
jgi:SAM-dependent methyltransferase